MHGVEKLYHKNKRRDVTVCEAETHIEKMLLFVKMKLT